MNSQRQHAAGGRRRGLGGFSLVEVSLALAIVAFAFTALLGVLPMGFRTFGEATDAATQARIAQKLVGLAQQTPFTNIVSDAVWAPDNKEYYWFDDQGEFIEFGPSAPAGSDRLWLYKAAVFQTNSAEVPGAGGNVANPALRTIVVRVETATKTTNFFNSIVADNGLKPVK